MAEPLLIVRRGRLRRLLWWLSVGLVASWFSYAVIYSAPTFQACIGEAEESEAPQQIDKDPRLLYRYLLAYTRIDFVCSAEWAHKVEGALTAFATLVIAAFTFTLWRATDKLWEEATKAGKTAKVVADATMLSAKAAIGIELPILRIIPPDLVAMDAPIVEAETYGGTVNNGPPTKFSGIGYFKCTNYGRTPAFPTTFACGWQVAKVLPEPPVYIGTAKMNHAGVYRPETESTDHAAIDAHFTIELSDQDIEATRKGDAWLWFYGRLGYEDFMGEPHDYLFCWRWADRNPPSSNHPFYFFASDGSPPNSYLGKQRQ